MIKAKEKKKDYHKKKNGTVRLVCCLYNNMFWLYTQPHAHTLFFDAESTVEVLK